MIKITFYDLEIIIDAASSGSITKTAENFFTTQQNISRILKRVELELNSTIFERSKKGVSLTPFGKEVLCVAENILNEKRSLLLKLKTSESNHCAAITLFTDPFFQKILYCEQLRLFLNLYQDTHFNFTTQSISYILNSISNNSDSTGIISLFSAPDYRKPLALASNIEFTYLFKSDYVIISNTNSPLSSKNSISLTELGSSPNQILCYSPHNADEYSIIHILEKFFSLNQITLCSDLDFLLKCISSTNVFISLIPHYIFNKYIRYRFENITYVPVNENFSANIYLVNNKLSLLDPTQLRFKELLLTSYL